MTVIVFHLYVTGATGYSNQIMKLYEDACSQCFTEGGFRIDLIDILQKPELAEKHKVLATPTISRVNPAPEKRIIGKVNSEQAVSAIQFLIDDLTTL